MESIQGMGSERRMRLTVTQTGRLSLTQAIPANEVVLWESSNVSGKQGIYAAKNKSRGRKKGQEESGKDLKYLLQEMRAKTDADSGYVTKTSCQTVKDEDKCSTGWQYPG